MPDKSKYGKGWHIDYSWPFGSNCIGGFVMALGYRSQRIHYLYVVIDDVKRSIFYEVFGFCAQRYPVVANQQLD